MPSAQDLVAAAGGSIHEHRKATRKMRWWYESLADFMIANPNATQNEIAKEFGRAIGTISTIINSDAFKAYMRQRRAAHAESLDASVRTKLLQVADKSFDLILERFEKKRDSIPLELLQKTAESTLKSLGYGQNTGPAVVVNNNAQTVIPVAVSLDDLRQAQTALRNAQNSPAPLPPPATDVEFSEVTTPSSDPLDALA